MNFFCIPLLTFRVNYRRNSFDNFEFYQKKISEAAHKIFQTIKYIATFPVRYFGAKTWSIPGIIFRLPSLLFQRIFKKSRVNSSLKEELFCSKGYSNFLAPETKDTAARYYSYCCGAAYAHSSNPEWVEPLVYNVIPPNNLGIDDLIVKMNKEKPYFFDPISGLKIVILEEEKEIVIAIGALSSQKSESLSDKEKNQIQKIGYKNLLNNILGGVPSIYQQADAFVKQVVQKLENDPTYAKKSVIITGQCYGGSIASFVALRQKLPACCFNTFPLGAGLQREIGSSTLQSADQYITHLSVKGDDISDPCLFFRIFDNIFTTLGIRTPGNFGKRYVIPPATNYRNSRGKIHEYVLGSLTSYLGHNERMKPAELLT